VCGTRFPLTFAQELITGYAVGSLALVADSFHMLK
jgi:Co/Zn/Cd efflux system component